MTYAAPRTPPSAHSWDPGVLGSMPSKGRRGHWKAGVLAPSIHLTKPLAPSSRARQRTQESWSSPPHSPPNPLESGREPRSPDSVLLSPGTSWFGTRAQPPPLKCRRPQGTDTEGEEPATHCGFPGLQQRGHRVRAAAGGRGLAARGPTHVEGTLVVQAGLLEALGGTEQVPEPLLHQGHAGGGCCRGSPGPCR